LSFRPKLDKELTYQLNKCFRCSFCRSQCPIYQSKKNETWNARGRMMAVQLLREGKISLDDKLIDRVYTCALCKSCEEICPGVVKVTDIIREVRCQLVDEKKGPLPEHMQMLENIKQTDNILAKKRSKEIESAIEKLPQKSDTILYMGCVAQYIYPKQLITMFRLLEKMNIKFTVLKDEVCCGNYLAELGLKKDAEKILRKTAKMLKDRNIKKIITLCPMCYNTFKHDLPQLKITEKIEVEHSTQLLEKALNKGILKPSKPVNMKLAYKDPCHLGRYAEVYDAPRNILKMIKGVEVVELDHSREFSRCCGGTIRVPYSDLRNDLCKSFFDEVIASKVDGVVTSCPTCFHNLYSTAPYDIKGVFDVQDILAYSLGMIDEIENLTGYLE
jgi:Fe-S oxidoreductase